ncbi:hypothetical protein HYPSUDRAFT_204971 [Hypholoma sublateritium FD-334 SS-4]|uniref:Uncharacterized protein n=1 Tax=Hypholoma sublateritium (strain FD-334 SS-4) TaxID=945553 RepID=A0A0D2PFD8_HYPSF|nr:hypothetical protein HYPSUDRAFT_204971 [Hypholoma sublateritium FD-334 SS-4]
MPLPEALGSCPWGCINIKWQLPIVHLFASSSHTTTIPVVPQPRPSPLPIVVAPTTAAPIIVVDVRCTDHHHRHPAHRPQATHHHPDACPPPANITPGYHPRSRQPPAYRDRGWRETRDMPEAAADHPPLPQCGGNDASWRMNPVPPVVVARSHAAFLAAAAAHRAHGPWAPHHRRAAALAPVSAVLIHAVWAVAILC